MMLNARTLIRVAPVGALLLLPACSGGTEQAEARSAASIQESTSAAAPAPGLVRAEFAVEGMTCGGCELGVRTVLNRLDGVERAEASHEESRAVVDFDPEKVDTERMIGAIGELGYTATLIGEGYRP